MLYAIRFFFIFLTYLLGLNYTSCILLLFVCESVNSLVWFFFVSATLLYSSKKIPETLYGIKTHNVDVYITRKIQFHWYTGYFGSFALKNFLAFIDCSNQQFVSVPLKSLHIISKTLRRFGNNVQIHLYTYNLDILVSLFFFCEYLHFWILNAAVVIDKSTAVHICWNLWWFFFVGNFVPLLN